MKGLGTVFRKEVKENLRDRRAAFNSLLLGPILMPLLIVGLSYFGATKMQERAEKVLELPIAGVEHAPNLVRFLEQQGVVVLDPPADPEAAVRRQLYPVVLRITSQFGEDWRAGRPARLELIADPSRRESDIPLSRVRMLLAGYSQQIGSLRLQLRGTAPELSSPLAVKDVDLSTPQSRGALAMVFLPYFLMITAFMGGMHIAIDATAGEKERRSLEPLLITPVPRWEIMSAKMLASAAFALASLVLTLLSFRLAIPWLAAGALGFKLELGLLTMLQVLVVVGPVAVLAAALLTMLATFAKGFREAQSYMGLVVFIPMIPSMLFMINPIKPEAWMMTIPIFGQNLLISEFMRGEAVPASWLWICSGGTLLVGFALAAYAATLFNRPRLVFGSG